jgi:hypothetical protein
MGIPPVIVTFALHTMPALWQFDRLEAYPTRNRKMTGWKPIPRGLRRGVGGEP